MDIGFGETAIMVRYVLGGGEKTMWAQHGGLPGQGVIGVRSSQSMGKGLSL